MLIPCQPGICSLTEFNGGLLVKRIKGVWKKMRFAHGGKAYFTSSIIPLAFISTGLVNALSETFSFRLHLIINE